MQPSAINDNCIVITIKMLTLIEHHLLWSGMFQVSILRYFRNTCAVCIAFY